MRGAGRPTWCARRGWSPNAACPSRDVYDMSTERSESVPPAARRGEAILSAKISAASALIGAVIGAFGAGVPAYLATNAQIVAESEQSRTEFLREQRQAAYAAYIAAREKYFNELQDNPQGFDAWNDELSRKIIEAGSVVEVVASPEARQAKFIHTLSVLRFKANVLTAKGVSGIDWRKVDTSEERDAFSSFVMRVRRDLGIDQ
jgi:hypothetical protein